MPISLEKVIRVEIQPGQKDLKHINIVTQQREYYYKYLNESQFSIHMAMFRAITKKHTGSSLLQLPDNWRNIEIYKSALENNDFKSPKAKPETINKDKFKQHGNHQEIFRPMHGEILETEISPMPSQESPAKPSPQKSEHEPDKVKKDYKQQTSEVFVARRSKETPPKSRIHLTQTTLKTEITKSSLKLKTQRYYSQAPPTPYRTKPLANLRNCQA
jgi:hypothetical protein